MFPHVTSPSGEASFAGWGGAPRRACCWPIWWRVWPSVCGSRQVSGQRGSASRLAARPVTQAFHILLNAIAALVSAVSAGVGTTRGRPAPGWAWELALRVR